METFTSTITGAEKTLLQETGEFFLDVAFTIEKTIDDGEPEKIEDKRLGFPIDTSADEIKSEIERYTANYEAEAKARIVNAERDAELAQADATIADLLGNKEEEPAINTPEAST